MYLIKYFLCFLIRFSGLSFIIRELICKNRVTIAVYHNPKPEHFKKHVDFLSKYYNFIPLSFLVGAIYRKDWADIPPKALVITFDDGFKENYDLLGIIKKHKINPTIFLCSHIINTNRKFWFKSGFYNYHKLKRISNSTRLKSLYEKMEFEPSKEYPTRQAMDLSEIKEMMPYVDFQSHSKFHPILIRCSDDESKEEIEDSKEFLMILLNTEVEHFSYPNGDYSAREIEYVKESGYKSARTVDIGWNGINSDPYKLKAMYIDDDASTSTLSAQVLGFLGYIRYLRHGSFNGKHPPLI